MNMDIVKRFVCGAKEAYKKVDNHSFNFLITIESAYRLATNIEKLLKEQKTVVRCMDCKFRGNTNLCPLAYIEKAEQFTALCTDEWFCGNGKRKEGW